MALPKAVVDRSPTVITDAALSTASLEFEAAKQVVDALKSVHPAKRLSVLRAASVLLLGKDLNEL